MPVSEQDENAPPPAPVTDPAGTPASRAAAAFEAFFDAHIRNSAIAAEPRLYNQVYSAGRVIIESLPRLDQEV